MNDPDPERAGSAPPEPFFEVAESHEAAPAATTAAAPALIDDPLPSRPVSEEERYTSLDVMRGAALLGILMVNMGAFAMMNDARYFPQLSGDDSGLNLWMWRVVFFGADTKFIQMFTMLFGAGIAVMYDRARGADSRRAPLPLLAVLFGLWVWGVYALREFVARGGDTTDRLSRALEIDARIVVWFMSIAVLIVPLAVLADLVARPPGRWMRRAFSYYRRMFFLLGLGLFHTFVIWDGDILFDYALFGLVLYFFMWIPWPFLLVLGLSFTYLEANWMADNLSQLYGAYDDQAFATFGEGGFRDQLAWRLSEWRRETVILPVYFMSQAMGHMLLGAAAYRSGFFTGRWHPYVYLVVTVELIHWGLWFIGTGTDWRPGFNTRDDAYRFVIGSFLLSLGYCGALIFLAKSAPRFFLTAGLASAGRMALTNYLMQSVVCTTIFYGFGFGQFGKWSRTEQMALILGLFVAQMAISWLWFRWARFGPVEWLWRSVTYWKWQPFSRRRNMEPITPVPVWESDATLEAPEEPAEPGSPPQEPGGDSSTSP
jgi:uncharacterized protein